MKMGIKMAFDNWLCAVVWSSALLYGQDSRVAVAIGYNHGVLLKADGSISTWGVNSYGKLGRDNDDIWEAVPVSDLRGIRSIAAGEGFTLLLMEDGSVRAWGSNPEGELGNGTKKESPHPSAIAGLPPITAIAASEHHAMALDSSGNVWEWGRSVLTPRQRPELSHIAAIAAGDEHSIVLDSEGNVWVWGYHGAGDLGDHCYDVSGSPQRIRGLSDMTAIAGAYHLTVALKKDGTVWTIGYGAAGQLGNGTTVNFSTTPLKVTGLASVKAIAAHYMNVMALKSDGTVWSWGDNHYRQLGNPAVSSEVSNQPVRAEALTGIAAIATAGSHAAAATRQGVIWNWGDNQAGALGADPEALDRSDTPMHPGEYIPPKCRELFACLTGSGKVIRICGTQDDSDVGKWTAIHYRFGPESGPPELMFPDDPDSAAPSLFYSESGRASGWEVSVRFSTGPYTYRVYSGERSGAGVRVEDAKGKLLSNISCAERPEMYSSYLKENLPCDRKSPQSKGCLSGR